MCGMIQFNAKQYQTTTFLKKICFSLFPIVVIVFIRLLLCRTTTLSNKYSQVEFVLGIFLSIKIKFRSSNLLVIGR